MCIRDRTNTIDLVFTGHEHRNGITQIANSDGNEIPVFSLSTKAAVVGQAIVTYDKIAGTYTVDAKNVPMFARDENRKWQPLYEADPDLEAALKPYETATWQDYMLQQMCIRDRSSPLPGPPERSLPTPPAWTPSSTVTPTAPFPVRL